VVHIYALVVYTHNEVGNVAPHYDTMAACKEGHKAVHAKGLSAEC
jgi:hypothetical protein